MFARDALDLRHLPAEIARDLLRRERAGGGGDVSDGLRGVELHGLLLHELLGNYDALTE